MAETAGEVNGRITENSVEPGINRNDTLTILSKYETTFICNNIIFTGQRSLRCTSAMAPVVLLTLYKFDYKLKHFLKCNNPSVVLSHGAP